MIGPAGWGIQPAGGVRRRRWAAVLRTAWRVGCHPSRRWGGVRRRDRRGFDGRRSAVRGGWSRGDADGGLAVRGRGRTEGDARAGPVGEGVPCGHVVGAGDARQGMALGLVQRLARLCYAQLTAAEVEDGLQLGLMGARVVQLLDGDSRDGQGDRPARSSAFCSERFCSCVETRA